jgi:hypothetical protein
LVVVSRLEECGGAEVCKKVCAVRKDLRDCVFLPEFTQAKAGA